MSEEIVKEKIKEIRCKYELYNADFKEEMKVSRGDESKYGISEENVSLFIDSYQKLIDYLLEQYINKNMEPLLALINGNDTMGKMIKSITLLEPNCYRCGAGKDRLSFTANGDIYPCDNFVGMKEFKLGNIYIDTTIDINEYWDYHTDSSNVCKKCWAKYLCSGDCYYNSYIRTGSMIVPESCMCEFFKKLSEMIIIFVAEMEDVDFEQYKVKASIITNGYYLSQSCFNELCKNDVRMFQVTFDGAKESHDVTRKLKDGSGGTFDKIMENIKAIKNSVEDSLKFEMAIRINFMKSTYKAVYGLIDELSEIINRDRRFVIYCRPVYNFETQRKDIESMQDDIFTIEEGLQKQTEFTLYIANKLNRTESIRSISDYLPLPAIRWCSEDSLSSIIVGYDGSIYFCDSLIGDEQFCVGMLKADGSIDYNEKNAEWRKNIFDMENIEQCKKCKCLPTCMGCCKRERILKNTTPCLYKEEDIYHYMQLYYENEYKR